MRKCDLVVEAAEDADPDVYASVSVDMPEDYQVTIPKSVTLDGKTKSGTYTVMVSGELSGEEILSVTQEKSVTLNQSQKDSVTGTVVQSKTKWSCEDLTEAGKGIISASDLSAGNWNGTFEFTIRTLEREEFEESITYTDFTLTADNYYMAGITRSGEVVIPETFEYDGSFYRITEIGKSCFYYCTSITSIVIPDSVLTIGNYAIGACYSLTEINIPKSVTSIASTAFNYCHNVENITVSKENSVYTSDNCNAIIDKRTNTLVAGCNNTIIPDSVKSIGNYAFQGYNRLTSVNIPEGVTSIGLYAFHQCEKIKSIYIPSGVTDIGSGAFYLNSSLKIYCAASESQEGWQYYWNYYTTGKPLSVTYGITREEYETLYKE